MRNLIFDEHSKDLVMTDASEALIAKYERNANSGTDKQKQKKRPGQPFNANLPFQLHQQFQALTQQMRETLPPEERNECTMTNWVISALEAVVIPTLKQRLAEKRGQGHLYETA